MPDGRRNRQSAVDVLDVHDNANDNGFKINGILHDQMPGRAIYLRLNGKAAWSAVASRGSRTAGAAGETGRADRLLFGESCTVVAWRMLLGSHH